MIKVLIIGLGSIGQRHAKALLSIGVENIAALRTGKGYKSVDDYLLSKIKMIESEEDAINWNPTHVIISNPTSLHKKFINIAINLGIPFLVEKPVSEKLEDVSELMHSTNVKGYVGYNLRFHGITDFVKGCIDSNCYGELICSRLHVGQYLPDWHPYEDYRKAYYANRKMGGGALRTLSHEIDLVQYFFGEIISVNARIAKLSNLEIDVDDVTDVFFRTKQCHHVNVFINYLDPKLVRKGSIYFKQGLLEYDFSKSLVTFKGYQEKGHEKVIYSFREEVGKQYELQMRDFILSDKNKACNLSEGLKIMSVINNCEESNLKKQTICLA